MKNLGFAAAIAAAALTFVPETASAQDASRCVSVGSGSRSQTLTNRCNRKIEVVWCHHKNQKGYRDGLCRTENKFYQKHVVLKPGEVRENKYTLPRGTQISYGACFGGYYSTKPSGMGGGYRCKTQR